MLVVFEAPIVNCISDSATHGRVSKREMVNTPNGGMI